MTGRAANGERVEVACDESGYEGDRLIGGTTDVFAHAGVGMDTASAADCVQELRDRIRGQASQYKANHLLRERHRPVLVWLLGPSGPLLGHAHVHLVDKSFFAVRAVVDLLVPAADGVAADLYRAGRRDLAPGPWAGFVRSANDLMRVKEPADGRLPVAEFLDAVGAWRRTGTRSRTGETLELLAHAAPRAESFRARLLEDPPGIPAMDPLVPALVRAVELWDEGRRPVSIVHDRQNALSAERVARLRELLPAGRLAELRLVEAGLDPRIQVADILAGAARKFSSDQLGGQDDVELRELLRPYIDAHSVWGDDRSWARLSPPSGARVG